MTVLYKWPKSPAAFEKYYPTHLKIVGDLRSEIGFTKAELTKFTSALDGRKAPFYRQAELYFPDVAAAKKGMATEGFKKVGDDFKNFATGGIVGLLATETGDKSDAPCPALVTVIYHTPKDPAAFETYYPTRSQDRRRWPGRDRVRACGPHEVRRQSGRQPGGRVSTGGALLPIHGRAQEGTTTPAFKKVGDDFKNFATGGLVGLVGEQK